MVAELFGAGRPASRQVIEHGHTSFAEGRSRMEDLIRPRNPVRQHLPYPPTFGSAGKKVFEGGVARLADHL